MDSLDGRGHYVARPDNIVYCFGGQDKRDDTGTK